MPDPQAYRIAALYRFARFSEPERLRAPLLQLCERQNICGTLLLAREGINGTIAGSHAAIDVVLEHIHALPGCSELEVKFSHAADPPFRRMKVRLKKEIVTMGQPDLDPLGAVGTYVAPEDWNALVADPETIVIDTRNDYEVQIGTFAGAINPKTASFSDFPAWFRDNRTALTQGRNAPKIAMFCTGGIRCEKSTAFLRSEGIEEVYHLKGGILAYLEQMEERESLWEGDCFVFDERVSVGHGLEPGEHTLCRACRMPLTANDRASEHYQEGVSCPHCASQRNEEQRARYAERQRQEDLAAKRGQTHIGARYPADSDNG
ncbi:rhodanese-related sulfurtransferase [Qipengyuania sp.]|uniref:oxygen-dependent tRNA uridine(34) hydroxylase TrhO n=1 Tax=Qipengyuania sp. TaxID=2004515 RepID=UPI0035C831B3